MEYIRVKNWRVFQHYTDRNPPWIKLHNSVLEDADLARLPDAAKYHMVGLWLLASRTDNHIPADPEFIASRINAKTPVDLSALLASGFIENDSACDMLASGKHADSEPQAKCLTETEQRRAEKRQTRGDKPAAAPPAFSGQILKVTAKQHEAFKQAFPQVDLETEYRKADSWLLNHPERHIKRFGAFTQNWLNRAVPEVTRPPEDDKIPIAPLPY